MYKRRVVKTAKKTGKGMLKYILGGIVAFVVAKKFLLMESVTFGTVAKDDFVAIDQIGEPLPTVEGRKITDQERALAFITKTSVVNSANVGRVVAYD